MSHLVFVSDTHCGLKLPHAKLSADHITSDRLDDVVGIFQQIGRHVINSFGGDDPCSGVLVLGDLFDSRSPEPPVLARVSRVLRAIADMVPVYLLPGNHDAHDRAGNCYALDLYGELRINNVHVLKFGEPIDFVRAGGPALCLHSFPWVPDKLMSERVERSVISLDSRKVNMALVHVGVRGATDGGMVMTGGLDVSTFKGFARVYSGHIHHPQSHVYDEELNESAEGMGVLQYLGSPLHLTFTDAQDKRGFWCLDIDTLEHRMVETDFCPFVTWTFLDDEDMNCDEIAAEVLPDLTERLVTALRAHPCPAYLRVTIEGDHEAVVACRRRVEAAIGKYNDIEAIDPETEEPEDYLIRQVVWQTVVLDAGGSARTTAAGAKSGVLPTPEELVDMTVELAKGGLDPDTYDPERLAQIGRRLLADTAGGVE